MKDFVKDLQRVERSLSDEKGAFNLFALFLLEDAPRKWDVVIAAPWAEKDKGDALKRISRELQRNLDKDEFLKLSRIVIIDQTNPGLEAFQRAFHVEHSDTEVKDREFFGLQVKHAHIITSRHAERA